jgi:hypothetical protein
MNYTDEAADKIIQDFHLDEKTKKVWKFRGAIPDKYFQPDAAWSPPLDKATSTGVMRMREILALPEIASTKFAFGTRGTDIRTGEARITEEELLQFKSEITQLRNKLRSGIDRNTFLPALKDPRVHQTKIISIRLYDRINRKMQLEKYEIEEAKFAFVRLYNLLRI